MSDSLRIAHLSDPHISLPPGWRDLSTKRFFAWLNWLISRWFRHSLSKLRDVVTALREYRPDAVLLTGDLGQLGLPQEFDYLATLLEPLYYAGIPVLATQGNHDAYGAKRGGEGEEAFRRFRERFQKGIETDTEGVVRLQGIPILLLDQGRPTPLFQSWGETVRPPLEEIMKRGKREAEAVPLAAGHYPIRTAKGDPLPRYFSLRDSEQLLEIFRSLGVRAYLCGHYHQAYAIELFPGCVQYCAGSVTARGILQLFSVRDHEVTLLPFPLSYSDRVVSASAVTAQSG